MTCIPFAWDSAQLAPEAHKLLDTLAEVLEALDIARVITQDL
jgi:outer membrane protein OmpA-like peptidoglycan-associated protein